MKKLRFQIRTWNRAEKLEMCVSRIAEEVVKIGKQDECVIFIIDNHSTDKTPKVIKKLKSKYPFIISYRYPKWCRMGESLPIPEEILKKVDSTFMWSIGDDDLILKDVLLFVWNILETKKVQECIGIHVAQASLTPHSNKIYLGTVWEFMNLMGFNQFAGWATSFIWNIEKRKKAISKEELEKFRSKWLPLYQKTAFPHILNLLHFHTEELVIVVDYPIIDTFVDIEEHAERWEKENIGWKYFLLGPVLKKMYQENIIKEKFDNLFFKYLNMPLWHRLFYEMIAARMGIYTRNPRPDEGWQYILDIAEVLKDKATAKLIENNVYAIKTLCKEYSESRDIQKEELKEILLKIFQNFTTPLYEKGWGGQGKTCISLEELNKNNG